MDKLSFNDAVDKGTRITNITDLLSSENFIPFLSVTNIIICNVPVTKIITSLISP